jgi:hypothetical protein
MMNEFISQAVKCFNLPLSKTHPVRHPSLLCVKFGTQPGFAPRYTVEKRPPPKKNCPTAHSFIMKILQKKYSAQVDLDHETQLLDLPTMSN